MATRHLLWIAVILLATPALAYSHDSSQADSAWQDRARTWEVTRTPDGFDAVGTSEEDVLRLVFRGASEEFLLDWKPTDGANLSLRVGLGALVEFQDRDGDLRYSLGDPVVERRDLAPNTIIRTVNIQQDGDGAEATISYRLRGSFASEMVVRLRFTESPIDGDPGQPPSWIAMETTINNYPFRSDNLTRLALETRGTHGAIFSDHSVGVSGGDQDLFFAWADTAMTPDGPQAAGTTIQPYAAEPAETLVVFSYGRNDSIVHEMTLGAARIETFPSVESLLGDWRVFAGGILISLAVIGLTIRYVVTKEN